MSNKTENNEYNLKLKETNKLLNSIFESIQDGISVLNKDLTVRFVNKTIERWHADDMPIIGEKCYEIYHNRDKPCDNCPTLRSFKSKKMESEIIEIKKQNRWIELYSYPMIDEKTNKVTGVVEFIRDITEKKKNMLELEEKKEELSAANQQLTAFNEEIIAMNEEMEDSLEKLNILNDRFLKMISLVSNLNKGSFVNEKEFLANLLLAAIKIVPEADFGKICIVRKNNKCEFINVIGHDYEIFKKIKLNKEFFLHHNEKGIYTSKDYSLDINKIPDTIKEDFINASKPIKKSIYINITLDNNEVVGRISLDIKKGSNKIFSSTSKKILKSFATLASSHFSFQRYNKLQGQFTIELIGSIIGILEMYDKYTSGHSENVAKIAANIAKEMGLSQQEISETYWAGMVHDIGKLLIPLDILNKNNVLTDREYDLIKKHPYWGYKALCKSDSLKKIAKYVLYHHERWDGKGYPESIKGDNIPLISQILAVADAWDAMTSKRSYRESLSKENALQEIKNNRGKQFSPGVTDVFLNYLYN